MSSNALDDLEPLADRLNLEPMIFRGSSSSELAMILTVATLFWLPVSLLVAIVSGVGPWDWAQPGCVFSPLSFLDPPCFNASNGIARIIIISMC